MLLLIIEALLLISAAVGDDPRVTTAEQIIPLDMAPKSVDDQFEGCTEKMADLVKTKLLEEERRNSKEFDKAWKEGQSKAKESQDNLNKNHSIAIYVYTDNIYSVFNEASRNDKVKYINESYEWYSLQFLLTEAIQKLQKKQNKCYDTTYRGINKKFETNVLNTEVRFGSFASSTLDKQVAQMFSANISCFKIKTCYGAKLTGYTRIPDEDEVLIPPYEKFKVTAVQTRSVDKDLWCDTVFELKSTGVRSDLNCALFNNKKKKTN